ncbi:hypothetical protein [Aliamphritea ceti]|uniref:hypothetical protein n=1 Tax=Aliamphritea ceti TaxID=1524258 RepID=UPI0021C3785D|nr:hypothetical protein [Aliamphritea ceti]
MLKGNRVSLVGIPADQIHRLIALYTQSKLHVIPYGEPADYIIYGSQLRDIDSIQRGTEPIADVMSQEDFLNLLLRTNAALGEFSSRGRRKVS